MATLYENFLSGIITDNPLTINATYISSINFTLIPVVASPNIMWLVLDPTTNVALPEIVKIVDHLDGSTLITVERAQQSTAARQHETGTNWIVSFTKSDLNDILAALNPLVSNSPYGGSFGAGAPAGTGTNGQPYYDTTNKRLYRSDGVGWVIVSEPTQTYVPTLTNMTLGSGSRLGFYHRSDGYCDFFAMFTMGSGSAMGTNPEFGLPVASSSLRPGWFNVEILDVGINQYFGVSASVAGAGTSVICYTLNTAGTIGITGSITSSAPMTWATGDILSVGGRFPMNTRYL